MAKGQKCPNCGNQTFHHGEGAMKCSSCGARGWLTQPDSMGSGRGAQCKMCDSHKVKTVAELDNGTTVRFCYECGATTMV